MLMTVFTVRCYRKSSVRPSIGLSVTLTYREYIVWTTSKLITRIISSGSSLLGATTSAILRGTSKNSGHRVALLSRKPARSLKRGKIGTRLLLMTTGSRIRAFDWCQNQRPWMSLKGHYTLCFKTHASFGAQHENLNEDRPTLSTTTM